MLCVGVCGAQAGVHARAPFLTGLGAARRAGEKKERQNEVSVWVGA
jgi:hypothetical protein